MREKLVPLPSHTDPNHTAMYAASLEHSVQRQRAHEALGSKDAAAPRTIDRRRDRSGAPVRCVTCGVATPLLRGDRGFGDEAADRPPPDDHLRPEQLELSPGEGRKVGNRDAVHAMIARPPLGSRCCDDEAIALEVLEQLTDVPPNLRRVGVRKALLHGFAERLEGEV